MVKKARLGADPLKWIQDSREKKSDNLEKSNKQENIDNLDIQSKQSLPELQEKSSKQESIPSREKKSDNLEKSSKQENIDNLDIQSKQSLLKLQEKSSKQESIPSKSELQDKPCNTDKEDIPGGWQRATFIIREKHLEKIKAIAYWDRLQIKEVIEEALEEYLAKREVKPMPPRRKS